ncbi:EAL domain-containing protein [Acetobacterium bakii]|uniref:EAL domain-containing protein n=1 Tax=Acetobacterium bakii TaxID=52689 RepID=UPI0006805D2A|nr:EAL domain-containing protein [Acetobacterium bakii]
MLQNLLSFILYVSFVIYIMFGVYSLTLNKEARLNQVFSLLCVCFSVWAFSFAMGNSAVSYSEVLFWRRISVLGWGVAYSLILHFIIVLTESNWSRKEKRPILLLTLYLPSVIMVFIFGLYHNTATQQILLVRTVAGWAMIGFNNWLDMLFYLYYLGFSLASIILLLRWYRKSGSDRNKKKALYLLLSFSASLVLGSFTDLLANRFLTYRIPSLAPVVIMIPTATIFYIIHKYGLMLPKDKKSESGEGVILSYDSRTKFFKYTGVVLAAGSMINFLIRIVQSDERVTGILLSLVLVLTGAFCIVIPYLVKSVKTQKSLLVVLVVIVLPVLMLLYFNGSFSNIIWPIPLLVIMITVIFNNKRMFYSIAILSLLMGIIFWVRMPGFDVLIGPAEYSLRLLFYGIAISLTVLIKKIYGTRLEENQKQEEFQKLILEISSDFVAMTLNDFDNKVNDLLKKSGSYINADRAYISMFSNDPKGICFTHEWLAEGIDLIMGEYQKSESSVLNWSTDQLLNNHIVYIKALTTLPQEAEAERALLFNRGIQSLIYLPVPSKDKIIGLIGFEQISRSKAWRIDDFELLKVLSNILADAIAKVETENEMNYLAYYDALTGLPNRVLFSNRLEQAIKLAKHNEKYLGVIFIDIDGFKEVNDALGHDWGDYLLKHIGKRLAGCIRKYDTVARFGGDEFLIMVPQLSQRTDLEDVTRKIMTVFLEPITVNNQEFYITASGGIAVFPEDGENVNSLIKNADLALYVAKKKGKGQVAFCSAEMKDEVLEKLILTNSLYQALERNELHLEYQPQVCIKSQSIIGFEALLRWNHPRLGAISPAVFIPLAEQTGLINTIGEWVLTSACVQNKAWQDRGFKPVRMAVNLTVEQFRSSNVEKMVKECLEKTGLESRYLELEITESIAMKESRYVEKSLEALKKLGVSISIDDFGTEYSSLSRLKDMPVDRLKIDMQFIQRIGVSAKDDSIIAVMIYLAKRLGLKVIAEGVETVAQLDFLRLENCDEVQGYYYYKPLSIAEIEEIIYTA